MATQQITESVVRTMQQKWGGVRLFAGDKPEPRTLNPEPSTPSLPRWPLFLPIRIISEANRREHWTKNRKRGEAQQTALLAYMGRYREILRDLVPDRPGCPLLVKLTALTPASQRRMDDDNLARGFKAVRDALAELLGVDDGDRKRVRYEYAEGSIIDGCAGVLVELAGETRITPESRITPALPPSGAQTAARAYLCREYSRPEFVALVGPVGPRMTEQNILPVHSAVDKV